MIYIGYLFKALKKGFANYKKILLPNSKAFKKLEINYPNNLIFTYKATGKYKVNKPHPAENSNSKKAKITSKSKKSTNIADTQQIYNQFTKKKKKPIITKIAAILVLKGKLVTKKDIKRVIKANIKANTKTVPPATNI